MTTITNVTPLIGLNTGGTIITITGTGFTGPATVTVGGSSATSIVLTGSTLITAITPAKTPSGTIGFVTIIVNGVTYGTAFQYTDILPTSGSVDTLITITGTNFVIPIVVEIGGEQSVSTTIISPTRLITTANVPFYDEPDGPVSILISGTSSPSSPLTQFTYITPSITNVTPLEGLYTGGTLVTITGTGFTGPVTVTFGGNSATSIGLIDSTLITAITPAGILTYEPIIVNGVTYGTDFLYTDILPTSGLGLTVVTIVSNSFDPLGFTVNFIVTSGPTFYDLPYTIISPTEITVIIPQLTDLTNGLYGEFEITTVSDPLNPFYITTLFTYSLIEITNFTPSLVLYTGGTLLTITGNNLTGPVNVTVGSSSATSVILVNSTTITALIPPGPAPLASQFIPEQVNVIITSPSVSLNLLVGFVLYTDISPATGSEGTPITIAGSNFICPLTVTIGGIEVSYTIYSSTELVAIAPAGTNGTSVQIVISGPSGPSSPSIQFTYVLPSITSITPLTGIYLGGTPITIIGNNFSEPVIVTIEGNQATNIILTGSTLITAVTPQTFDFNNLQALIVVNGVTYNQPFIYVPTFIRRIGQYIATVYSASVAISPILIGPAIGGTYLQITISNFLNPIFVTVGGIIAPYTIIYTFGATIQLRASVPPGIPNTFVDIVVNGVLYSKQYNYVTPTITSINPYEGGTAGGTQVVITGTNFTYPPIFTNPPISEGGFTNVSFVSSTKLIAITLPISPLLTLPYTPTINIYGVDTNLFTYYNTGYTVTPNIVVVGNTTTFIITGPNVGLTAIFFGNIQISILNYTVNSPIQVTITPPPGFISTVPIYFTFGSTNIYVGTVTYINTFLVNNIFSENSLSGGNVNIYRHVDINSFAIPFPSTATKIKIGLQYATGVSIFSNNIQCVIPPGVAGSLPLLLQDAASTTLATSEILYRYVGLPTITSFTPPNGLSVGGSSVVIKGTEFVGNVGTPVSVTVDGYPVINLSVDSDTQLTFILPPKQPNATNTPPIIITTVGGSVTNILVPFSYVNPRITGITPQSGSANGGTPITITGTNFSGPINVLLGPNNATNVVVVNSTTITAIAPRGTGTVALTVANATLTNSYTYILPSITNVYPVSGSSQGGTSIIITGIYFTGATNVYINGVLASSVVVVSDTEITADTPALLFNPPSTPPGPPLTQPYRVPLVIEWPNNLTTSDFFTYDDTLLITSVYPSGGVTDGGTPIRINGIGFINPLTVTIGGNPVGNIVVDPTGTFITGTTPPGNIGRQDLIVVSNARTAYAYFTYLYPLPQPPYSDRTCPGPPYNATNFTSANGPIYSTLQSYAKNSPNYPWDTGVNSQEIYRSQQNTVNFTSLNQQTIDVKNTNNRLITSGLAGNVPYPPFKSQADRLSYVQGLTLNASRNKITGQNPSVPMGVPCSTIYEIIYS